MLDVWQQSMRATGAAGETVRTRTEAVRSLLAHSHADDPMMLTSTEVTAWLADCRAAWTRSTYWSAAHAYYGWLVDEGLRGDNPVDRIKRPRSPRGVPRPVSDVVIERMLTNPISGRCLEYTTMAVLAGLRVSEIARVHGSDVNLHEQTLFVRGKGGVEAFLPLHPRIAMLARGKPTDDYWFPSVSATGHVRGASVSQTLKRGLAAAGAPNAVPHQLRHSYGTAVLRNSRDLRVTQELMRHRSPVSTAVYTQVDSKEKTAAISHLPWTA